MLGHVVGDLKKKCNEASHVSLQNASPAHCELDTGLISDYTFLAVSTEHTFHVKGYRNN